MVNKTEIWLRGPLDNIPVLLQPVAHALLQAREELNDLIIDFPDDLLWENPAGLASPGFHIQHLAGILNRLFTYAMDWQLNRQQMDQLALEGKPDGRNSHELVEAFNLQVDKALTQLESIDETTLTEERGVGRMYLPSTVIGLYVHAAEHTMRHTGQLLVTVKILKAGKLSGNYRNNVY